MSRELDRRRAERPAHREARADLNATAERITAALPGEPSIRIAAVDPRHGFASEVRAQAFPAASGDVVGRALAFAQAISPVTGLGEEPEFAPDPGINRTSVGGHSVNFQNQLQRIDVFETTVMVRFDPTGGIRDGLASVATVPDEITSLRTVTAAVAVLIAARHVASPHADELGLTDQFGQPIEPAQVDLRGFSPVAKLSIRGDPAARVIFEPGPFGTDIQASLVWFTLGTRMRLCWGVELTMPDEVAQYFLIVDAGSGDVLYCRQRTETIAAAGNVYRRDASSPREMVPFPPSWDFYGIPFPAVGHSGWQRCSRCAAVFLPGGTTRCPSQGSHTGVSGETYVVVRNSSSYPGERGWRCCAKCGGLFFSATPGICPAAGAAHADDGSGNHVLQRDAPLSVLTHGWRRCSKCGGLFLSTATSSVCPGGGPHDGRASGDYNLAVPTPLPTRPTDWVAANTTSGNSTLAHAGPNGPPVTGTASSGLLVFDPADPLGADQRVLNAYYFCCYMHDLTYLLGFREANGNFQVNELGVGGIGADPVHVRVYAGPVPNTASMVTGPEGTSPVLKLGAVSSSGRHTALDATVVFHEFMHGITNRLVGGPKNVSALAAPQSAGMGEGWSDYFSCTLCGVTVIANWVLNNKSGLRRYPYDSAFPDGFGSLGKGRYLGGVHNTGEVWAATLMEVSRRTDRDLLLQLVIDALKLTRPLPTFLDARDAIVIALDQMAKSDRITTQQHDGAWQGLWSGFARFGMGPAASCPDTELRRITADPCVGEHGWARCQQCAALYLSTSASVCPQGGPHRSDPKAAAYDLVVDQPRFPGQGSWRRCQQCGVLYLGDGSASGCPAGGSHTTSGSEYRLITNAVGSPAEGGWWRCSKCQALWSSTSVGSVCPSAEGSRHTQVTAAEYFLIHH